MSQTYLAIFINLVVNILPKFGINIGNAELQTTIQTISALITGVWVLVRRYRAGDINALGVRK